MRSIVEFLRSEDGPTSVEYAIQLAIIVTVCIAAIDTLGKNSNKTFSKVGSAIGTTSS
jgi:pilus assembly protein Flp/PilA